MFRLSLHQLARQYVSKLHSDIKNKVSYSKKNMQFFGKAGNSVFDSLIDTFEENRAGTLPLDKMKTACIEMAIALDELS